MLVVKSKAHLFEVLDSPSKVMHLLVRHAALCMTLCLGISVRGQINGMLQVLQEKHTAQLRCTAEGQSHQSPDTYGKAHAAELMLAGANSLASDS